MNQPKINFGVVKHRRLRPAKNAFGYGVFTLLIPMRSRKQNPELLNHCGVNDNRLGICSFYDTDHGQGNPDSLAWIENILKESLASSLSILSFLIGMLLLNFSSKKTKP